MTKYKIFVCLSNNTYVYKVNDYEIQKNGFIRFLDIKTNKYRLFDSRVCEIVEEAFKNGD